MHYHHLFLLLLLLAVALRTTIGLHVFGAFLLCPPGAQLLLLLLPMAFVRLEWAGLYKTDFCSNLVREWGRACLLHGACSLNNRPKQLEVTYSWKIPVTLALSTLLGASFSIGPAET